MWSADHSLRNAALDDLYLKGPEDDLTRVETYSPKFMYICTINKLLCGPGSVVGIATTYGLDGLGIESRWGEIFRNSPDRP